MSSERTIDLADSAAKNTDENIYRLNLLARTTNAKPIDTLIFKKMIDLLILIKNAPPVLANLWQGYFDSFISAMTVTSSERGWFIDKVTTMHNKTEHLISEQKKQTNKMFGLGNNTHQDQS